MNPDKKDPPINPEEERSRQDSVLKDTYDPADLVRHPTQNPEEIGSNPGVAPETNGLNEPAPAMEGYKFD